MRFGDIVENTVASKHNPIRFGVYLRVAGRLIHVLTARGDVVRYDKRDHPLVATGKRVDLSELRRMVADSCAEKAVK